jgi:hypothetical protein
MNILTINSLFRAYLIENKKSLLILGIIIFGITVFFYTLPSVPEDIRNFPSYLWFWLAGTFFQSYFKKNSSTHFFNLPATTGEKFTHAVVVILFAGIVIELLTVAGAFIGTYLIHPLFYINESNGMSIFEVSSTRCFDYLMNIAIAFAFLFGSIYFRKNAFLKSLAIGIGVLFAVAIYFRAMERVTFGETLDGSVPIAEIFSLQNYYFIIPIIFTLFFLFLTYLRLRETEV